MVELKPNFICSILGPTKIKIQEIIKALFDPDFWPLISVKEELRLT